MVHDNQLIQGATDEVLNQVWVNTKGSCFVVDHTKQTSWYELCVNEDPPRVVAIGW